MFPLIPFVCGFGFIASFLGLVWYDSLSQQEKDEADAMATRLAWELYAKSVNQLTQQQMQVVNSRVRSYFGHN